MNMIIGIDYGSKLAGTTVICYGNSNKTPQLFYCNKNEDADEFIHAFVRNYQTTQIGIDAPLSLPLVYANQFSDSGIQGSDYFYRQCDKQLGAMSPMFLGGLTARAMQLKHKLAAQVDSVFEVYPAAWVKQYNLNQHYNKKNTADISPFLNQVKQLLHNFPQPKNFNSWHAVDAWICWSIACKKAKNEHTEIGNPLEGIIVI
jgi:predicted nuclease with RNAse H fold